MEFDIDWRNEIARVKAETDATFLVNENDHGTILDATQSAEEMFGYFSRYETIGKSIDDLVPPRLRESHRQHRTKTFKDDQRPRYLGKRNRPIIGLTKSGKEIPLLVGLRSAKIFGRFVIIVDLIDMTGHQEEISDERH